MQAPSIEFYKAIKSHIMSHSQLTTAQLTLDLAQVFSIPISILINALAYTNPLTKRAKVSRLNVDEPSSSLTKDDNIFRIGSLKDNLLTPSRLETFTHITRAVAVCLSLG